MHGFIFGHTHMLVEDMNHNVNKKYYTIVTIMLLHWNPTQAFYKLPGIQLELFSCTPIATTQTFITKSEQ